LEPSTHLFLVSTLVQSMSSIPMALQYGRNEPVAKRDSFCMPSPRPASPLLETG
jgi:hypothetical protein